MTRGKTRARVGNLVALLTLLKGLPMTYNRDLQEDKERLFDSIDTIKAALAVIAEMIRGMKPNVEALRAAADDPMLLATDLADYLVRKGLPFREAHEVVGRLTAFSLEHRRALNELTLDELRGFSKFFTADALRVFDLDKALESRKAPGAPSPQNVAAELAAWRARLKPRRARSAGVPVALASRQ